jgi:1,2-dihydroxy-3-keto-5-methylthiopentene dioxygenase
MSSLFVYQQTIPEQPFKVLTHAEDIASTLAEHGVGFERCQVSSQLKPGILAEDVIEACRGMLDTLTTERGYVARDVISVNDAHPQKAELRAGYLQEHHHQADELRLFVSGRGLLSFHIEDRVFALICEKNDLVSIPAGIRHWLDLGERPHLVAIRLFNGREDAVAVFTGEALAGLFPELDDL